MADADKTFKVRVETEADTSGIQQERAALGKLREEAAVSGSGKFTPGISAVSNEPLAAAQKEAAIQSQLQTIAATRLELGEAQIASDEARVAVLQNELRIRSAVLGVMRAETLTAADLTALAAQEEVALGLAGSTGKAGTEGIAAGALLAGANLRKATSEATVLAREVATGSFNARTLGAFLGALGPVATAAAIGGFFIYDAIKRSNEETDKLIKETNQLGVDLENAGKKWQEAARGALTPEDVRKIAEAAIPELDKVHAKVAEIQQTELHWWQSAIQQIRAGLLETLPYVPGSFRKFATPYTDQLNQIKENAAAEEKLSEQQANAAIRSGKLFENAFERRKALPLAEALSEIVGVIEQLEAKQKALNTGATDYAKRYAELGTKIEQNDKQLRELIRIDKERNQVVADGKTELERVEELLRAIGVTARTPAAAFTEGSKMAGALGDEVMNLAARWAKLQEAQRKGLESDLFKSPAAFATEAEQRRREHEAERAARAELGQPFTPEEDRRFQQQEELRDLRRKNALARSLVPEGGDVTGSEGLNALGRAGLRKFEEREERIKQLRRDLGEEAPALAPRQIAPGTNVNTGEIVSTSLPGSQLSTPTSKLDGAADKLASAAEKLSQGKDDGFGKEIVGLLRSMLQSWS